MSKKTARELYDEMGPVVPGDPYTGWGKKMKLYHEVLGEESEGMTAAQWFHYLDLPWSEKKAYSDKVKEENKKKST